MDIVAYVRMLRRHWKLIVATTVIGVLIGAASAVLAESGDGEESIYYKATHTLFLDTSAIGQRVQPIYTNLDQIAVLVTTGDVPREVADELGGDRAEWSSRIFTTTNGTTNTLDITCAATTADDAVTCADTFADTLLESLADREQSRYDTSVAKTLERLERLNEQIDALDAQRAANPADADLLKAQRDSLVNQYRLVYEQFQSLADQGGPASVVSTLEAAEAQPISESEYNARLTRGRLGENRVRADVSTPMTEFDDADSSSNRFSGPVSRGVLGGLLGLLLGVGLAVALDRVDRRLRTREEVEAAFGMPILAEVPALTPAQQRRPGIMSVTAPLSRTAEAYRAVRSSLMFQHATDTRPREPGNALVILVASAGPKEGKTTTSANLATMFAETGQRVLAVNCDFRRPALHNYFRLANEPRRVFETTIPNLWAVTDVSTGPSGANPAFVVDEQRRLIASARRRFDVIVLDTAPLLTTNDATEIMGCADYVVVVCRSGVTTADAAHRTRDLLSRIAAPISGVVFLGSSASPNDYYYYYSRSQAQRIASESSGDGDDDESTWDDELDLASSDADDDASWSDPDVGPAPNGGLSIGSEPRPSP